jgi:hypothetical protein
VIEAGTNFVGFKEGPIDFPPTYKFDVLKTIKRVKSRKRFSVLEKRRKGGGEEGDRDEEAKVRSGSGGMEEKGKQVQVQVQPTSILTVTPNDGNWTGKPISADAASFVSSHITDRSNRSIEVDAEEVFQEQERGREREAGDNSRHPDHGDDRDEDDGLDSDARSRRKLGLDYLPPKQQGRGRLLVPIEIVEKEKRANSMGVVGGVVKGLKRLPSKLRKGRRAKGSPSPLRAPIPNAGTVSELDLTLQTGDATGVQHATGAPPTRLLQSQSATSLPAVPLSLPPPVPAFANPIGSASSSMSQLSGSSEQKTRSLSYPHPSDSLAQQHLNQGISKKYATSLLTQEPEQTHIIPPAFSHSMSDLPVAGTTGSNRASGIAPPPQKPSMPRSNTGKDSLLAETASVNTGDGVYDSSSKQRVPSWSVATSSSFQRHHLIKLDSNRRCDRIIWKSTVEIPPDTPDTIEPLSSSGHGLGYAPGRKVSMPMRWPFGGLSRAGSLGGGSSLERGRSPPGDSVAQSVAQSREPSPEVTRYIVTPTPLPPDIVVTAAKQSPSVAPSDSPEEGKQRTPFANLIRKASFGKKPRVRKSKTLDEHSPTFASFATNLPHAPGGTNNAGNDGIEHLTGLESGVKPPLMTSRAPATVPLVPTLTGRSRRSDSDPPLPSRFLTATPTPSTAGPRRWFSGFGNFLSRDTTLQPAMTEFPIVPPKPKPKHKRGEVVCLDYGTLDDVRMRNLEGRSDHRPIFGTYSVYI